MFSIRKKTMIIIGMIALLLVTGYLNYRFNTGDKAVQSIKDDATTETGNFFTDFRSERGKNREQEITYLDSIISNQASNPDAIKEAQNLKLDITKSIEKEGTIEGLLKAKGFADAVVTFHTGSVNVVVKDKELSSAKVAKILDVVIKESGEKAENVKVIPSA